MLFVPQKTRFYAFVESVLNVDKCTSYRLINFQLMRGSYFTWNYIEKEGFSEIRYKCQSWERAVFHKLLE